MRVAIVGGGITGLFAAYFLERAGAEVTVFDDQAPGARSVHAAGIIEPTQAYRTNTVAFLHRLWRYWWSGTCTFRSIDGRWLLESLRQLERAPASGVEETLCQLGQRSIREYTNLAAAQDDFGFTPKGLVERYDAPAHFTEERQIAVARQSRSPVEVRERADGTGDLFFPHVAWLHTERFVERMLRELHRTTFVRARVRSVGLDGSLHTALGPDRFDRVVATTGVTSRSIGLPLTAVRGYGWHLRARTPVDVATIHVDRGVAVVPFARELKVTGGWDFDLSEDPERARRVLAVVRQLVDIEELVDFKDGWRPCTPDGLPTVGRKEHLVVANGGFRLGWSFAPALGEAAALLALGRAENDPFLARFCGGLHAGAFA